LGFPESESNISVPHSNRLGASLDQSPTNQTQINQTQINQTQTQTLKVQLFRWGVHPYVLVILAWLLSLAIAGISIVNMIKIDPSVDAIATTTSPTRPETFPESAQELPQIRDRGTVRSSEEQGTLPLFSLGAVAFSCAVGCLLMSRRSKPGATLTQRSRSMSSVRRLPRETPRPSAITESTTTPIDTPRSSNEDDKAPALNVSVMPSDQSHPLDWDEPSIADNLDLRQTRPVSYWL
jgi:hypothetical protein